MPIRFYVALLVAPALLLPGGPVWAQPSAPVTDLSRATPSAGRSINGRGLLEIMNRLERLQREVRELRGLMEENTKATEDLGKRQRDLYLDLDRRIGALEQRQASAPPPAVSSVPAVAAPGGTASAPDPARASKAYDRAFDILKGGHYEEARAAFAAFLRDYPGSPLAANAQYWMAETLYVGRDFPAAMKEFKQVVTAYPNSGKVPDALLKIGYIHYEDKDWATAREVLQGLKRHYPDRSVARLAEQRLARMQREGH